MGSSCSSRSSVHPVQRPIIGVIGGGIGGCCSALQLAKTGNYTVFLLEKNSQLMSESSNVTPGRMGLGFHYADTNTALFYLRSTLEFTKKYGQFRQELARDQKHSLRRGRYFIMKNSGFSVQNILQTYQALKEEYTRLVRDNGCYELFGDPEEFYKILAPREYEQDVCADKVELGLETAEELLDWPKFKESIINQLEENKEKGLLKIKTSAEVTAIDTCSFGGYTLKTHNELMVVDALVNASWYNIGKFNKQLGITDVRKRRNRLKAIATISLPPKMLEAPSMFFCMGAYAMFSNKGNGVGMVTYAPETNIAVSSSQVIEPEFQRLLFGQSVEEKSSKGKAILEGVCQFIPGLKDAEIRKVEFGVIQTFMDEEPTSSSFKIGNLDFLHDPKFGEINKRDYSGVEMPTARYVVNACMKLLYCYDNAVQVVQLINKCFMKTNVNKTKEKTKKNNE
ncbi:uncharacterized protein LOC116619221 [Nematostella vectensis]|uniref:uncharacterized protein LOC116619221 n=1 Tax=Nematostella vectensis TaxID=45351 RepID=UPI0020776C4C|nr:uncharacterized protein LOC116619221 [Nematostella vectensis]